MSVYKRNRSKSKIDFYYKAIKLNDAICEVTDNPKYYGKRQTFRRAIPLMELSRELLKEICVANSIYPTCREDYVERRNRQIVAIGLSEALLQQFQSDCLHMKTIPGGVKKHITGLAVDVEALLKAWKKSDATRFKNLT